jgi:predicted TIM-barrel fold metal-dependent hydrolase
MAMEGLKMKFYDAHIHFFYNCSADELEQIFEALENIGLAGMDVLVISEFPPEMETVLKMIPGAYHPYVAPQVLENQKDPFPALALAGPLRIIPFLDARFIGKNIEQKVRMSHQRGFKGLKLLYVPEEDLEYRVGGMEKAFGRTPKHSERITSLLIESASAHGMSILMHVDLRKHGEFVAEMIRCHPQTNFNIPHFGFSRRAISSLLDHYSNCYTDLSSLKIFMEGDLESYRNFTRRYQDRILFGSDALVSQPENIQSALTFLERFLDDGEIFLKLAHENYLTFHRLSNGT